MRWLLVLLVLPTVTLSAPCNSCSNDKISLCAPRGNDAWSERVCARGSCFVDAVTGETGLCRSPQARALAQWVTHESGAPVEWENLTLPSACSVADPSALRVVLNSSVTHSKDLIFAGFDFGDALPESHLVMSLRLNLTVQALDPSNDDIQCRVRTIVLKDEDGGHTSASRDDESFAFPSDAAGAIVFGDKYDLWDVYVVASQLVNKAGGVRVHVDLEAFSKHNGRLHGNVTCVVACVELIVDHAVAPIGATDVWSDYTKARTPFFDNTTGLGTLFTLVDESSVVKWRYNKAVPANHAWTGVGFDDGDWKQGNGEFSSTRGGTSIGKDAVHGFFRTSFVLPNSDDPNTCYRLLRLEASFRAGGRVWLNGHLLWQRNMPNTVASDPNSEFAIRKSDGVFFAGHINEPVLLRRAPAPNVLAVEVHEESADDERLLMDFVLEVVSTCAIPLPPVRSTRSRTPRPPETDGTRRPPNTVAGTIDSSSAEATTASDLTEPENVANNGAAPLNGIAIGALVFAVLFCAAGAVLWWLARKRQSVMKI